MRRLLVALAAFFTLGLLATTPAAQAQISCNMTYGTSKLCVTNNTPFEIVGVEAGTFMNPDGHWVPIPSTPSQPGAYIAPGMTKIVDFPVWQHGTCIMNIFVETWQGTTHMFPHTDVCHTTRISINRW